MCSYMRFVMRYFQKRKAGTYKGSWRLGMAMFEYHGKQGGFLQDLVE